MYTGIYNFSDRERTQVVFSTGVNTDSDMQADESQGLVVYFSKDGDLRVRH